MWLELGMPNNLTYQPGRGNWIIHEDGDTDHVRPYNNDLWSCLPDGSDDDLQSDGCIRIGTLNDLTAEWTGGVFDASASTSTCVCSTTCLAAVSSWTSRAGANYLIRCSGQAIVAPPGDDRLPESEEPPTASSRHR
jgi:hypothetical protein